jgi:hypothetical protein
MTGPSLPKYPGQKVYSPPTSPTFPSSRMNSPSLAELNETRLATLSSLPKVQTPFGFQEPMRFPIAERHGHTLGNRESLFIQGLKSTFNTPGKGESFSMGFSGATINEDVPNSRISVPMESLDAMLQIPGKKTSPPIKPPDTRRKRLSLPAPLQIRNSEFARTSSGFASNRDYQRQLSYHDQTPAPIPVVSQTPCLAPSPNFYATVTGPVSIILEEGSLAPSHSTSTSLLPNSLQSSQPPLKRTEYQLPQRPKKYRLPQRPSISPTLASIRKLLVQDPSGHAACTAIITGLDLREAIENGGPEKHAAVEGLTEILTIVIGLDAAKEIVNRHMRRLLAEISGEASYSLSYCQEDFEDVPGVTSHRAVRSEVGDLLDLRLSDEFQFQDPPPRYWR